MPSSQTSDLEPFIGGQLSHKVFEQIRNEYRSKYGFSLVYSDLEGNLIYGLPKCDQFPCQESCRLARQQSIEMVINFGSPLPSRCPSTYLFWSLPVCLNNRILGGLITAGVREKISPSHPDRSMRILIQAQEGLIEIAERYNIINNAFLQQRRVVNRASSDIYREATTPRIPDLKDLWRTQSKYFFDAVKDGDRKRIFSDLTGVLTILRGADPMALPEAKGFALELFASTIEAAINGKHERKIFFVFHYEMAEKIVLCRGLDEICNCIQEGLETFLQATHNPRMRERNRIVRKVLNYIENHVEAPLNRDEVARKVGVSPSRLSHLLKEETKQTFSDIVKRFKMERSRELLIGSDKSISFVAIESGFCDQSHFTKVFQKYFGISPAEYRREHSGG